MSLGDMVNSKRPIGSSEVNKSAETNDGTPAKRSRVSRACDQCRAGREKCDGSQPECLTCSTQDRQCSYNEQAKKRGIRSNYIRTLESTLAWIFQTFPESEALLSRSLPIDNDRVQRVISGKDATASELLHSAWRECLVNKQIDSLLSGASVEKEGRLLGDQLEGVESTDTLYQSPPLSVPSEINGERREVISTSNADDSLNTSSRASREEANPLTADSRELIKLPENALALLEYYFSFTHSWIPMTDKGVLLKLQYSYPGEGLQREQMTMAEHAELWSIMALAAAQMANGDGNEGHRIRRTAESLLPSTKTPSFEVPHIKAMILLTLIDALEERILAAWLRISTVVSLLLLFNLLEKLGTTERWCRHIHLAAFIVETAIANRLHVATHFSLRYISTIGQIEENGLDEWSPWYDPWPQGNQNSVSKAPTAAFSTLNKLVQMCMRSAGDITIPNDIPADSTVVFALLRNAAIARDRLQPSTLVESHSNSTSHALYSPYTQRDNHQSVSQLAICSPLAMTDRVITPRPGIDFISMPNELNTTPQDGERYFGNNFQSSSMAPNHLNSTEVSGIFESAAETTPGANIFEEFNAILEQNSDHHPQFLQNLGFAPDIDLAEFFGADYQPSDPLLSYMHPAAFDSSRGGTMYGQANG